MSHTRAHLVPAVLALLVTLAFAVPAMAQSGQPDLGGGAAVAPSSTLDGPTAGAASPAVTWAGALEVLRRLLDPARATWSRSAEVSVAVRVPGARGRAVLPIRVREAGAASSRGR